MHWSDNINVLVLGKVGKLFNFFGFRTSILNNFILEKSYLLHFIHAPFCITTHPENQPDKQ